ncbi:hypothetical protein GCM10011346_37680 [Oceanobacillus neutriphilus]|uniref:Uncharacterized protein n=1 Tax=Oceanobacillus neutriphilus TaxID=531815 RepID=A0ABQ2NZ97_9BACI|nr:hypothetical protein GCM10011346_37680 [Oceanobacillus neutriphilus]
MRTQLKELEKNFRTLAEEQQVQSQKSFHDILGVYYSDDTSEEAAKKDLKKLTPHFPKGVLEGMSCANEQVANYISNILCTADKLTEKNVHDLLLLNFRTLKNNLPIIETGVDHSFHLSLDKA